MSTFSFPVRDLFIATGYASETTAATFIASASTNEVAVLKKDGSAAAVHGEDAYVLYKDSNGRLKASDTLKAGQIKLVTKVDPVTVVPAYASFDVSVSGLAAGDIYEGLVRISGYGSLSPYDEYPAPFFHNFVTGDTVDTVAEGLIKSLSFEFSKVEGKHDKYVNFITGYDKVFTTKAAVVAGKATLTDGTFIWVMEDNKAWIVADKTASTFATICTTEKTDWSTELGNGTAEYLNANPWFHFVKLDGATPKVYIIAKNQPTTDMKLQGYDIIFKVGLRVLDGTSFDEQSIVTVTNVGKVSSPGEGKNIRRLEVFAKGHTGDFYRGMGYPNNFDATYDASVTTNYYIVNVEFYQAVQDVNTLSGHPSQKLLQIACATSGVADSVYAALAELANHTLVLGDLPAIALNDLSDVVTTGATDGEQLTFVDSTDTWEPGASGV